MYNVPEDFKLREHQVLENKNSPNSYAIKLLEAPYSGIIYSYGEVSFDKINGDANEEHATLKFEYDVHDWAGYDFTKKQKYDFEIYLGDFLRDLIIFGLKENNITYKGGIDDENRTGDPIEPDSQ